MTEPFLSKKNKKFREISGVLLLLAAILVLLALASFREGDMTLLGEGRKAENLIGPVGAVISYGLRTAFGALSYFIAFIIAIPGIGFLRKTSLPDNIERISAAVFLMISFSALVSMLFAAPPVFSGGYVGLYLQGFLKGVFGDVGGPLVVIIFCLTGMILAGIVSVSGVIEKGENSGLRISPAELFARLKLRFRKKDIPINDIAEKLNRRKKRPWIEKRTILIYKDGTRRFKEDIEKSKPLIRLPWSYEHPEPDADSGINSADPSESWDPVIIDRVSRHEAEFPDNQPPSESRAGQDLLNYENVMDGLYVESEISEINREDSIHETESGKTVTEDLLDDLSELYSERPMQEPSSPGDDAGDPIPVKEAEDVHAQTEKMEANLENYSVPVGFLNCSVPIDSDSWNNEVRRNSELLVNTLAEFGIESKVVAVNRGPVITLYEMQIAPGIKLNRVTGLADDIAMALAAYKVRIVAPIPGKSAIGIEIPNLDREDVTLGDIISSHEYKRHKAALKVILGKDILGKPLTIDLKKMPHLLIAGATGSGKSVCVNALVTSLIYSYTPAHLRFIMVDPKMVELQLYNGLPHMLTPVITEPGIAPSALKWTTYEMERRYHLLSDMNTRDIEKYNEKVEALRDGTEPLPYIVFIIDELADLMMVSSKEIEGYITRIAQKARAVGIHLVLATQRPSVDIITGIIKANFPARIAFQVAQKTDSRTIIDQNGAEKLLGRGDMLYQSPFSSFPVRIQGAFISEDEIMEIVAHLRKYGKPEFINIEESLFEAEQEMHDEESDELFVEALKIVEETRKASASYLQRRLSIGYNRAARIIELMEDRGYVGPQQGSKPREVFI